MKKRSPGSTFHNTPFMEGGACIACNNCPYMKLNTLEKIYNCMKNRAPALELPANIMERARLPLERMLQMSASVK